MSKPTHNTLDHLRALIHARRRLAWSSIKPLSSIVHSEGAIIKHFGRAY